MGLVTLTLHLAVGLVTGLRGLRWATDGWRAAVYPDLCSDFVYISTCLGSILALLLTDNLN